MQLNVIDINSFLAWLATGGGATITASWILEQLAWFQALTADSKKWTFFGVSAFISVASLAAVAYIPASMFLAITPYFMGIAGTFLFVFFGSGFNKATTKP